MNINTNGIVITNATPIEVADGTVVATTVPEVVTTDGKRVAKKKSATRKSLKGEWGKVGAPPKAVNWPTTPFTSALLFCRNPKQCELGLRNKIKRGIVAGTILALATKKQPGGSVGRPKSVYVLTEHFDPATMTLAPKAETPPVVVNATNGAVVQPEPVVPELVVDTQVIEPEPVSVVVLEVTGDNNEPALEPVTEASVPEGWSVIEA